MFQREQTMRRTEWAERHVEEFLSLPFIREFVFRSPQMVDGTQREVADLLVAHSGVGVLISQKCQEDPRSRDVERTESWARKKAKEAVSQLRGALRTASGKPFWCDHPRRGRVEFTTGLPKIDHGIVLIEVLQPVDLGPEASALPLDFGSTPISYLSVNDFLNLAVELRTVPELLEYLNARRLMTQPDLRLIGDEQSLFEFYLLNDGSLHGCASRIDVRLAVSAQQDKIRQRLMSMRDSDYYSGLLEHVADQLATRNPDYAEGLSAAQLAGFEPLAARSAYLEMQGVLANLRLRERAELGRSFHVVIDRLASEPKGFAYSAAHFDSRPEWVFLFGASKKLERAVLLERMELLMSGAMAFYGKRCCLMVADGDGLSYEVSLGRMGSPPTLEEYESGNHLFSHLPMVDTPLNLVPGP
jgi:hypothetical protein